MAGAAQSRQALLLLAASALFSQLAPAASAPPRTAVCISGQVRTLESARTYESVVAHLFPALGGRANVDVFMFLNLDDGDSSTAVSFGSGRSGSAHHSAAEVSGALAALRPVVFANYTMDEFSAESEPRHGSCMARTGKKPQFDWSYHAPQFWGVSRCLRTATAHAKAHSFEYGHALRVRPDGSFDANITAAIQGVVASAPNAAPGFGASGHAWLRGDSFAVLAGGAIGAFASIYTRFLDDNCATLPKVSGCGKATRDSVFGPGVRKAEDSTECLIVKHLASENVRVVWNCSFTSAVIRPAGGPAKRRRRRKRLPSEGLC